MEFPLDIVYEKKAFDLIYLNAYDGIFRPADYLWADIHGGQTFCDDGCINVWWIIRPKGKVLKSFLKLEADGLYQKIILGLSAMWGSVGSDEWERVNKDVAQMIKKKFNSPRNGYHICYSYISLTINLEDFLRENGKKIIDNISMKEVWQKEVKYDERNLKRLIRMADESYINANFEMEFLYRLEAAQAGDVPSMFEVSELYSLPRGTKKDLNRASEWRIKALPALEQGAEAGDARSKCCLGRMFFFGRGVAKDREKGFRLVKNVADVGHAFGWYWLGKLYVEIGNHVPEAIECLERAGKKGCKSAYYLLGLYYKDGDKGFIKSYKKALSYLIMSDCQIAKALTDSIIKAKDYVCYQDDSSIEEYRTRTFISEEMVPKKIKESLLSKDSTLSSNNNYLKKNNLDKEEGGGVEVTKTRKIEENEVPISIRVAYFVSDLYDKYGSEKGLYFPNMGDSSKKVKTSDKISGAIRKYAKEANNEIVIALNDASILGDGEKGFLLTTRKVYTRFPDDKKGSISYDRVKSVDFVSKGLFSSEHNIVINSGDESEFPIWKNFCDEKVAYDLIKEVVSYIKLNGKSKYNGSSEELKKNVLSDSYNLPTELCGNNVREGKTAPPEKIPLEKVISEEFNKRVFLDIKSLPTKQSDGIMDVISKGIGFLVSPIDQSFSGNVIEIAKCFSENYISYLKKCKSSAVWGGMLCHFFFLQEDFVVTQHMVDALAPKIADSEIPIFAYLDDYSARSGFLITNECVYVSSNEKYPIQDVKFFSFSRGGLFSSATISINAYKIKLKSSNSENLEEMVNIINYFLVFYRQLETDKRFPSASIVGRDLKK